ncbi:hypothetical protein AGMMS50256_14740 [Betaproteobacteria bacterium]|nr:hypothetical protein AGMMS50256_14740 [Betaproteobacteria bacterium]
MGQLRMLWASLPPWFKTIAIVGLCLVVFGLFSHISLILVICTLLLWSLCIACVLHSSGRLGQGQNNPLFGFLGWLSERASAASYPAQGAQSGPAVRPPPSGPRRTEPLKPIDVDEVSGYLKSCVIGQNKVCEKIADALETEFLRAGRKEPLGVFLFVGAPETGKTHLARELAAVLKRESLSYDMSLYSDPYALLSEALKSNPQAVILLDNFEKIPPGILTPFFNGSIGEISAKDAIFILSTNAAHETIADTLRLYHDMPEMIDSLIRFDLFEQGIDRKLLDGIGRIMVFSPPEGLDLARIAILEIRKHVNTYGMNLAQRPGIPPEMIFDLIKRKTNGSYPGILDLQRSIKEKCSPMLAAFMKKNKEKKVETIIFHFIDNKIEVRDERNKIQRSA